jgi:hypothetical protein
MLLVNLLTFNSPKNLIFLIISNRFLSATVIFINLSVKILFPFNLEITRSNNLLQFPQSLRTQMNTRPSKLIEIHTSNLSKVIFEPP